MRKKVSTIFFLLVPILGFSQIYIEDIKDINIFKDNVTFKRYELGVDIDSLKLKYLKDSLPVYLFDFSPWGNYDNNQVPIVNYPWGDFYNPVTTSQTALSFYSSYLENKNPDTLTYFLNNADWLVENHDNYYYRYGFDFPHSTRSLDEGWVSGMAQGEALAVLVRAYSITKELKYLESAEGVFNTFHVNSDSLWTFMIDSLDYYWIEEYPNEDFCHVFNGKLFASWGLWDYYSITEDINALKLFEASIISIVDNYHFWNVPFSNMSHYCLHKFLPHNYHEIHLKQLNNYSDFFEIDEFADIGLLYMDRPQEMKNQCGEKPVIMTSINTNAEFVSENGLIEICSDDSVLFRTSSFSSSIVSWEGSIPENKFFQPVNSELLKVWTFNDLGCSNGDSIQLVVKITEPPKVTPDSISICEGEIVEVILEGDSSFWVTDNPEAIEFDFYSDTTLIAASKKDGCYSYDSIRVYVNKNPDLSYSLLDNHSKSIEGEICKGDTIRVFGNGADLYLYNQEVKEYHSLVAEMDTIVSLIGRTLVGCSSNLEIPIKVAEYQFKIITTGENLSVYPEADNYMWFNCDSKSDTLGTDVTFVPFEPGFYSALLSKNGCNVEPNCIEYFITGSDNSLDKNLNLNLSPNPTLDVLNLRLSLNVEYDIVIVSTDGKVIDSFSGSSNEVKLEVSRYLSGTYTIIIKTNLGTISKRFIRY